MPGILQQAAGVLAEAPAKLDAAGIKLIRYWGGLDVGVSPSDGPSLPGEDRVLWFQPHCTNFFEPVAASITADLTAPRRPTLVPAP